MVLLRFDEIYGSAAMHAFAALAGHRGCCIATRGDAALQQKIQAHAVDKSRRQRTRRLARIE
ncbi:MAG: hypothetical protein JNJ60_06145 [Rhodocyclaceae bacterium]|nr:hypothetical protein [Rhodocyclaceae bacterium]